jgi:hypothetical protein
MSHPIQWGRFIAAFFAYKNQLVIARLNFYDNSRPAQSFFYH